MKISKERLMADLVQAYLDARRHKIRKASHRAFEDRLESNLRELCDSLFYRNYQPYPSSCFLINDPKLREIFAADFRDRIVHHLYFNYTHVLFERTFITDSYSCIENRGIHYGVNRLERFIRKESQNYTQKCYVLKMDIRGYFMHIPRPLLLDIVLDSLHRMAHHKAAPMYQHDACHPNLKWCDVLDMEFIVYLSRLIILLNPLENCIRIGNSSDWNRLPSSKSLFYSPEGCGLPIGNLTSQLFSNVFLNRLDQFAKRELHCSSYGRYVDDFYVVSSDCEYLLKMIHRMSDFLHSSLGLEISHEKTCIADVFKGVEFLGAYIKPRRSYVRNHTVRRIKSGVSHLSGWALDNDDASILGHTDVLIRLQNTLSSYCGHMRKWSSYRLRQHIFDLYFSPWGSFDEDLNKFEPSGL